MELTDPEDLWRAQTQLNREKKIDDKSLSFLHVAPGELTANTDTMTEKNNLYPRAELPGGVNPAHDPSFIPNAIPSTLHHSVASKK